MASKFSSVLNKYFQDQANRKQIILDLINIFNEKIIAALLAGEFDVTEEEIITDNNGQEWVRVMVVLPFAVSNFSTEDESLFLSGLQKKLNNDNDDLDVIDIEISHSVTMNTPANPLLVVDVDLRR